MVRWGGLRIEPYKPEAIDADSDMIVQEGTAWERPGGTRILDATGREIAKGMTSLTRPKGLRVVDQNDNDVDYAPSYGEAFSDPASVVAPTDQGRSGLRAINDMGIMSVGDHAEARRQTERPVIPMTPEPVDEPVEEIPDADVPLTGRDNGLIPWDENGRVWADLSIKEKTYLFEMYMDELMGDLTDEDGIDVSLMSPEQDESDFMSTIRGIIESPKFKSAKAKVVRGQKFRVVDGFLQKFLKQRENKPGIGDHPQRMVSDEEWIDGTIERERAGIFFRVAVPMMVNLGAESLEDAMEQIEAGIDLEDGRRVEFVGMEIPYVNTYAEYPEGTYVMRDFKAIIPNSDITIDFESAKEEVATLLEDPNAPIPFEMLVGRFVKQQRETEASKLLAKNARVAEEQVMTVGRRIHAEVERRFRKAKKDLDERVKRGLKYQPDSHLGRLFNRSDEDRSSYAWDMAMLVTSLYGRMVKNDVDNSSIDTLDTAHLPTGLYPKRHLTTEILNRAAERAVTRILGRTPEWAKTERLMIAADPDDPNAPGDPDAERYDAWPFERAQWNGSPEYLFENLIADLSEDLTDGKITEQEFITKIDGLVEEVETLLIEEIRVDDSIRNGKYGSMSLEELTDAIMNSSAMDFESDGWSEVASLLQIARKNSGSKSLETWGQVEDMISHIRKLPTKENFNLVDELLFQLTTAKENNDPSANDLEFEELENLLEELSFRTKWVERHATRGDVISGLANKSGEIISGKAYGSRNKMKHGAAEGTSFLKASFQVALADAMTSGDKPINNGAIVRLRNKQLLTFVGAEPDKGEIIMDILREIREFSDYEGTEEILSTTGKPIEREAGQTRGERQGLFNHKNRKKEAQVGGTSIITSDLDPSVKKGKSKPVVIRGKDFEDMDSDTQEYITRRVERVEEAIVSALSKFFPTEWIEQLRHSGTLSISSDQIEGDDITPIKRSAFVPVTAKKADGPFAYEMFQDGRLLINPETGQATKVHEVLHAIDHTHPLLRPIIMAHIARRLGLEPEDINFGKSIKSFKQVSRERKDRGDTDLSHMREVDDEYMIDAESKAGAYSWRIYTDGHDDLYFNGETFARYDADDPAYLEAIINGKLTVIPLEVMSTIMEELALPPELRSKKILDKDSGDVEMIQLVLGLLASV